MITYLFIFIVILVAAFALWCKVTPLDPTKTNKPDAPRKPAPRKRTVPKIPLPAPTGTHEWQQPGFFGFDIVGESHYQEALAKLAGEHGKYASEKRCLAHLIPENDNPYDNKAVRVDIDGMTVGYLDRDTARSFRRRLGAKKLTGQTTTCQAELKGGYVMRDGNKASYGVALNLKEFD